MIQPKYNIGDIISGSGDTLIVGEIVQITYIMSANEPDRIFYTVHGNGTTKEILQENALRLIYECDFKWEDKK